MTLDALKALVEAGLDAINFDLKGNEEFVSKYCDAKVEIVWRNAIQAKKLGLWVELTTLVIPGFNDSEDSLRSIARRIVKDLGKDTPWHVSRFYPSYKFEHVPITPSETLEKVFKIGKEEGLNFVYVGNILGHKSESTFCPRCNETLIKRYGFDVVEYKITRDNKCSKCGEKISIVGKYVS